VTELAEQNAGLVSAVSGLRQTFRLLLAVLALAFAGLGVAVYSRFF
jgi:hypothetical protein